eukprot:1191227-Prorocentrum_minimum.AAC.1
MSPVGAYCHTRTDLCVRSETEIGLAMVVVEVYTLSPPAEYKQDSFDHLGFDVKPKPSLRQINIAGKMVELGCVGQRTIGALTLSVVSSVSIVVCNKWLISNLGFHFGACPSLSQHYQQC